MAPSHDGFKTLFLRCTDASLDEAARQEAATAISNGYRFHEMIAPLSDLVVDGATPPAAASFALRVLYVGTRKWPSLETALGAFRRAIADARLPLELKTQAFLHLLLLDLDEAESWAYRAMPAMLPLVRAERLYPTLRRETAGAAYEEATLKLLFH